MKLISWNVNGLRACMGKGFLDFVAAEQPDMLCPQETRWQPGQADVPLEGGYREYWNSAEKRIPGVALFSRPSRRTSPMVSALRSTTTRSVSSPPTTANSYLVTVYTPNSQNELGPFGLPAATRMPSASIW